MQDEKTALRQLFVLLDVRGQFFFVQFLRALFGVGTLKQSRALAAKASAALTGAKNEAGAALAALLQACADILSGPELSDRNGTKISLF